MNIQVIEEHSVDLDLLPENGVILDAGCLGFEFTHRLRELGHTVWPIDINDSIPAIKGSYNPIGIAHKRGIVPVIRSTDIQATKIDWENHNKTAGLGYPVYTIEDLQEIYDVHGKFDLIKLDVEGEEYEILKQAKHPIATQVSVEFHTHCGVQTKEMLDALLEHLSQWYTIHGAVWESRHGCSENYWDVLLIAKL